jgi:hypothetical protein
LQTVGQSAFEVLSRHSLEEAIDRATGSATPISASLRTVHGETIEAMVTGLGADGGILLQYPASKADTIGEIEHDLTLHDRAPVPAPLSAAHSLAALPILALDTETTGLDPGIDRILSIGAVRMVGPRIYRGAAINELVNPGRKIPPGTIAIHGISNAMVAGAPVFADVAGRIEAATAGLVLLGHHIDFDCAMIRAEMRRIGRECHRRPPTSCWLHGFTEAEDVSLTRSPRRVASSAAIAWATRCTPRLARQRRSW